MRFSGNPLDNLITSLINAFAARLITAVVIGALMIPAAARAELASEKDMDQVCLNWLTYIVEQTGDWAGSDRPEIIGMEEIIENDTVLARYYAISPGGYVIVPTLMELPPVKAYSEEYQLDIHETDGFPLMIRQVLQDRNRLFIEGYGSLQAIQPPDEEPLFAFVNRDKWNTYAVAPEQFSGSYEKQATQPLESVGPLLTTAWHQSAPYNNLCPWGDGGRCVVGCVATAAAQIMYYHQWPPYGIGSHTYYWGGDKSCDGSTPGQYLTADFSDPYVYDNSAASVAEVSYEMGVAFEMEYGYCGSGAYTMDGANVFPDYFNYDPSAMAVYRNSMDAESWFNTMKNDINKGRPLLYRIYLHAIVCDGWQVASGLNQLHFNYGWGGSNNAWYTVDNLHCTWSGCNPMVEAAVKNIIPLSAQPWLGSRQYTDDLGDGDGIPEAGETVELIVTMANYGGDVVTDLTATLTIDDATITMINDYSDFGPIPANDSVTNAADPFVFEIPAGYPTRVDSFFLEVTYNGGAFTDTMIFEGTLGPTTILLVDDDENDNCEQYYINCFDRARMPYDIWVHSAYASPDAAYLGNYDIVLWFTGDYRANPLNTGEIAAMKGYLDGGGKLLLSGQGIAAQLSTLDVDFLNNYLKADFVQSLFSIFLEPVSGNQTFDTTGTYVISGTEGASNQTNPDLITAVNGGVAELRYSGKSELGAVSYSGAYRVLFMSFGFEAIRNYDSRFIDRNAAFADMLDFFGYTMPRSYPMAAELTLTPGDPLHLTDHHPAIAWSYYDPDSWSQEMYQVQVGTDNGWETIEMWDHGPAPGADTQVAYGGLDLLDGEDYFVRTRVFNGALWSEWVEFRFVMNSTAIAEELSPAGMDITGSATPYLNVVAPQDNEADLLVYSFELYNAPDTTTPVAQAEHQPQQFGSSTRWLVPVALEDDEDYLWRVRVYDGYEEGDWSEFASFWVNSLNHLPEPFDLLAPDSGTTVSDDYPVLTWEEAVDVDLYDEVKYKLYISADPNFGSSIVAASVDTNAYQMTFTPNEGVIYYWKVVASDLLNYQQTSSSIFSFTKGLRGDANGDNIINVGDAVYLINYIFRDGLPPDPFLAGDANCDGTVNVGDAVFMINHIFKDGAEPGC